MDFARFQLMQNFVEDWADFDRSSDQIAALGNFADFDKNFGHIVVLGNSDYYSNYL